MTTSPAATVRVLHPSPHVAVLELSNPGRLNSFTCGMWQEMMRAVRDLQSPASGVRCIVIRGADGVAFAAGSDIREFREQRINVEQARVYGALVADALMALEECELPLVAAIEGPCVGGGLAVAAWCDVRIAGESSTFGVPVKRLGLVMSPSEMRGIHALAGPFLVKELLLEGRIMKSGEAHARGLLSRVVPDAQVQSTALAVAASIAEGAPLVARWHKRFVRQLSAPPLPSREQTEEAYKCFATEDYLIGLEAFETKQQPVFKGR